MKKHAELTVDTAKLPASSFLARMQSIQDQIASRAYELFASTGFTDGHDLADWFSAESELLQPIPLEVTETENDLRLKAELPGFTEKDIEVRVEPHRLFILGQKEETLANREEDEVVYSGTRSSQVFRTVDLPAEVDPAKARFTLDKGELNITVPKAQAEKKDAPAPEKAAA